MQFCYFLFLFYIFSSQPKAEASGGCGELLRKIFSSTRPIPKYDSPAEIFTKLSQKNYFLRQNADYLDKELCGGTCTSVSTINNMLVAAEKQSPGAISNMSRRQVRTLHVKLMQEFMDAIKKLHNHDGRQGASLQSMDSVYQLVYRNVFKKELDSNFSVTTLGHKGFQSIRPGENSLITLSVRITENAYHAIVLTGVKKSPSKQLDKTLPEEFLAVISDPHAPNQLRELKVYESGSKLYLEEYGVAKQFDNEVTVEVFGKTHKVRAIEIQDSAIINFQRNKPTKTWAAEDIKALVKEDKGQDVTIFLKNGTVYNHVALGSVFDDTDTLYIYHRFMLNERLHLSEIANIVPN